MSTRKDHEEAERGRLLALPLKDMILDLCALTCGLGDRFGDYAISEQYYGFWIVSGTSVKIEVDRNFADESPCWIHALVALRSHDLFQVSSICETRLSGL